MKQQNKIFIGTSGWHYPHWVGPFYPAGTKPADFFEYYKKFFSTLEINNSFYRLPEKKTFQMWKKNSPEDFIFSVKASRYITHIRKLNDPKEITEVFFDRVAGLGKKCGPILFQFPPSFRINIERLSDFLRILPKKYKYTFEFRHKSWHNEDVTKLLQKYNAAFCIYELEGFVSDKIVTADFVYIRLHGPDGKYAGSYSDGQLKEWADFIKDCHNRKLDVFCYFDNDQAAYAPKNALKLKESLRIK